MKGKDTELIKKYEADLQNLRDVKGKNDELNKSLDSLKEKYHTERKQRKEMEDRAGALALEVEEHKSINTAL
jgi:hypothetical protein